MNTPSHIVEVKEEPKETLPSPDTVMATDASAGEEPVLAANLEPSNTEKKKRGRPRKSGITITMMGAHTTPVPPMNGSPPATPAPPANGWPALLALPAPPPPSAEPASTSRRRRGRPRKAYRVKLLQSPPAGLVHNVGTNFVPSMLTVPSGHDIIQELLPYVQEENTVLVPFSASGDISSVTFHCPAFRGGKIKYQGLFHITVLQGSLNRKYGLLSLCMTDPRGLQIGGSLGGSLIAGGQVLISFGTFVDVIKRKYKKRQRQATASAAAGEVDDGEMVDVAVNAGETVEISVNGSAPGTEGSDEGEPIMASPVTILPPASSLPEGPYEEEPIMAIPITILPPALSLTEEQDEEEPIMASPITIVPPFTSLPVGSYGEEPVMDSSNAIGTPASSVAETPDDQNESVNDCGSDSEK